MDGEKSELIKRVSNQNKNLKHRFDEEVISKQSMQMNLKEIYKPITDTQQLTTGEISKHSTKTDVLFQQLLNDLQGKHDRSSRLLADIIRGLARSNEETRKQGLDIVSAIAKQPLLPELINELNNYPALVKKIMQPDDLQNLTDQDRKALEPLSHLNDNDLRTLVNYYTLQEKVKPGLSTSDVSSDEGDLGSVPVFHENPTNSPTYKEVMSSLKKRNPGLNDRAKHGIPTVSPIFYYEANDPDTVKFGKYNVLFKEDKIKVAGKEYTLTPGLELLLNRANPTLDDRITNADLNNYLNISLDAGLDYRQHVTVGKKLHSVLAKLNKLNELQKNVQVVGNGLNTVILPDNVDELKKRLALLLGEYSAGNKSMFNEINAILDILLKKRKISKTQLRNILHEIKS
jgi:hypothetical protein